MDSLHQDKAPIKWIQNNFHRKAVCAHSLLMRITCIRHLQLKLAICLLFFLINFTGKAQLPEYYVYLIKGDANVKRAKGKLEKIEPNGLVYNGNILLLQPGAEITLVDKSNNFIVVSPGKSYKVDTLYRLSRRKAGGVTKKYLKLIWDELLNPTNDYSAFKMANLTEVSGGVSRGRRKCNNLVFPVDRMKISEDAIHFKWLQTSDSGSYNLSIIDRDGKKLEFTVSDTTYTLNASALGEGVGKYCWLVKGSKSVQAALDSTRCEKKAAVCFELITKEQEAKMVSSLVSHNVTGDLATQLSIIATLEKNGFIYYAVNSYDKLIRDNPDNKALSKSYVSFLLKYGFNDEALSLWNDLP